MPNTQPDLSIIIVAYKSQDRILPLLDSIHKSRGKAVVEVIVVNNYSQDQTLTLAGSHKLSPITLDAGGNLGFSKSVNIGLAKSTGKYIVLINPDCEFTGKSLEKLLEFARSHPGLGGVGPKLIYPDGKIQPSAFMFPTIGNAIKKYFLGHKRAFNKYYPGSTIQTVEVLAMACMLIPKTVFERIGGLDEKYFLYYEDIEFCRRLAQHKLPLYFYPAISVKHVHGASGNFQSHLTSPLAKSAQIYHGVWGSRLLNFVLRIGQKYQKIIKQIKHR
jgi:N-acetylglucosaminyl-diphospho-decaprenol L-rhamnosyltransferase